MKKILCTFLTAFIVLSILPMPISAASADTLIKNLSAFRERFSVATNDISGAYQDAFIKKPELVFYYNGMSCTVYSNRADCTVQYANTDVAMDSIRVVNSSDGLYGCLRSAMANAETTVNVVFCGGKNQNTDFSELIDRIHKRDYIAYMGYNSISVHKFSNKYSEAAAYQIEFTYGYDSAELVEMKKETKDKVNQLAAEVFTSDMSEYMLVKSIHDYLIENTKYAENNSDPMIYYAFGPLVKGTGVCEGYAEAGRLLFDAVGIESVFVSGTVDGNIPHAWNIVKIGGAHYHIDITWDDPVGPDGKDNKSYEYFNITDSVMAADHAWSGNYPSCTAADKGVGATQTTVRLQSQQETSVTSASQESSQKTDSFSQAVTSKPSELPVASVSSTASPAPQPSSQTIETKPSVSSAGTMSEPVQTQDLPVFPAKSSDIEVQSSSFELSSIISTLAKNLGLSVPLVTALLFVILTTAAVFIIFIIFKRKA